MEGSVRFGLVLRRVEVTFLEQLAQLEGGLSKAAMIRRLIRKAAFESGLASPDMAIGKTQNNGVRNKYSIRKERVS